LSLNTPSDHRDDLGGSSLDDAVRHDRTDVQVHIVFIILNSQCLCLDFQFYFTSKEYETVVPVVILPFFALNLEVCSNLNATLELETGMID
jgi:hypothetical protein